MAREALEARGCELFGLIVSRVPPEATDEVADALGRQDGERPVYVLAEQPELANPSVGMLPPQLGVEALFGAGAGLQREVRDVRVAAMSVEHFIADLVDGTLVIVPGDRADILVACLAANVIPDLPAVAGIVMTAGYEPGPTVRRLLERAPFPVLAVPDRTLRGGRQGPRGQAAAGARRRTQDRQRAGRVQLGRGSARARGPDGRSTARPE